jgi:predicted nucleotidyltransferase
MLQVKPDTPLPDILLALIHSLDQTAKELEISYFIIGATARDIVMENVYGIETTRATRDVDFAVAVASWEEFNQLKDRLIATGSFFPGKNEHRLTFGDASMAYPLDLVPFKGVEKGGEIAWPPEGDIVMNVTGYTEAYDSALDVEIAHDFQVKVISMPAMVVLKILAWKDQPNSQKHVADLLLILRNYHQLGQSERLYTEQMDLLDLHSYDIELSGAGLLGRDAKRDTAQEAQIQVRALFQNERSREKFNSQMMKSSIGNQEQAAQLVQAFLREYINEA